MQVWADYLDRFKAGEEVTVEPPASESCRIWMSSDDPLAYRISRRVDSSQHRGGEICRASGFCIKERF